jgi:hypothetical protein
MRGLRDRPELLLAFVCIIPSGDPIRKHPFPRNDGMESTLKSCDGSEIRGRASGKGDDDVRKASRNRLTKFFQTTKVVPEPPEGKHRGSHAPQRLWYRNALPRYSSNLVEAAQSWPHSFADECSDRFAIDTSAVLSCLITEFDKAVPKSTLALNRLLHPQGQFFPPLSRVTA